jgi:DNA polymerase-3 subunit epsilon
MESFAVIDLETTGFGKTDRILEIAMVLIDDGQITHEWETLVNPQRDIPNKHIHGLGSDEVSLAPTFNEIADQVAYLLNGRVLVAHNISFDARMISQEFERLRMDVDLGRGLCTLRSTKLSLARACEEFEITNEGAHRALTDARATTELLLKLLPNASEAVPVHAAISVAPTPARIQCREEPLGNDALAGMETIRNKIPDFSDTGYSSAQISYTDAFYSVMSDFYISEDERLFLDDWAEAVGLSLDEKLGVHQDFINLLVHSANRDNFISETEQRLIKKACQSLQISDPIFFPNSSDTTTLSKGLKVCFTGTTFDENGNQLSKETLADLAVQKGLVPVTTVTKRSCDLLVAADISSMSGKTQLARKFGIKVISAEAFLKL